MEMRDTLGVLLAGGAGERLFPLTRDRAKPAVPFGGHYRIIDITLSNCINSGLRKVYILTQYKALSLNRHVREGWTSIVAQELGEFFELLPPMQRTGANWYMGTADAVYQNIYSIGSEQPKHMIILSGDHIYKMDYSRMLEYHNQTKAECTLATLPISPDEVSRFGVVEVAQNSEITGFLEKPASTTLRSPFNPNSVDASMGIYIFNTETLLKALIADAEDPDSKHDFGHNILPNMLGKKKMMAYSFVDENKKEALYWRDVGTLDAYYDANMDLCSVSPVFNLYDRSWPMRTRVRQYPPAKFVFGEPGRTGSAVNSIITAGVIISGATVSNSVLSQDVRVNSYSDVDSSVIFSHVNIGPALPHPALDHRPRRAHSRRDRNRIRPGGGQAAIFRDAIGTDDCDARCVAVRKPGGSGLPAALLRQWSVISFGPFPPGGRAEIHFATGPLAGPAA
jgi:glucose-1-phosphate adenylyltransferase